MTKEELLNKLAELSVIDNDILDEVKKVVDKNKLKIISQKSKKLPQVVFTPEEFLAIEEYSKLEPTNLEPMNIVLSIDSALKKKSQQDVMVGLLDLYVAMRTHLGPTIKEMNKQKKLEELNSQVQDIISGKVPA